MPKYLAHLRTIAITTVPDWQRKLHAAFEYLGFTNITVNPDSRSVYFEYWMKSTKALAWHIQRIIREKLSLDCQVVVKSSPKPPKT